jgi:hypothetical protein
LTSGGFSLNCRFFSPLWIEAISFCPAHEHDDDIQLLLMRGNTLLADFLTLCARLLFVANSPWSCSTWG